MDFVVQAVEVKAVEQPLPVHAAQLISYLRLTGIQAGLLVNFHAETLRRGLRRLTLQPPNPSGLPSCR
jgi:GxxExxY protein